MSHRLRKKRTKMNKKNTMKIRVRGKKLLIKDVIVKVAGDFYWRHSSFVF